MQLGITIPLQKFLKWKPPVYGEPENLFFCWDLHVIRFHGENTLMAVNASNAFTVILWKMEWADWENLEQRTLEAIRKGLLAVRRGDGRGVFPGSRERLVYQNPRAAAGGGPEPHDGFPAPGAHEAGGGPAVPVRALPFCEWKSSENSRV